MKDREKRRDRTLRAQARAYRDRKDRYERHLQFWGGGNSSSRIVGEPNWLDEPHRFAKNGQGACDCRHKHHGQPKVGKGTCQRSGGKYRDDVRARITWRHVHGNLIPWLRAGFDPLDFEG